MKHYILKNRFCTRGVQMLLLLALLMPTRMFGVGWTPTDGGLVVDLEQGEKFLLSVWIDLDKDGVEDKGEEFFVNNYNRFTDDLTPFRYPQGLYLKLIPQDPKATEPSEMSIWSVGAPLARGNCALGGIVYTIWNDGKLLRTNNTNYQFMGDLTSDYNYKDACDVVFVVPTDQASRTSFDPSKTLRREYGRIDQNASTGKINGKIGKGFLGMTYREVYMLDIPRSNSPKSYTNASLVSFNTTTRDTTYAKPDAGSGLTVEKGKAVYAYADKKHNATVRTLFRLYLLDRPFNYCNSYYFAIDEQDVKKYRKVDDPKSSADSTAAKKIYTIDWMTPMKRDGSSQFYKTGYMNVPDTDSAYYYVGYNNDYKAEASKEKMGNPGAYSQFENIRDLPMKDLPGFKAPAGAYGKMVIDTTSTANNLGVSFEPAGYFLKVSTGTNVRMRQTAANQWTCDEMWTISDKWASLSIKATLMTGAEFDEKDPGHDIPGWSTMVVGTSVPLANGSGTVEGGMSGWARITTTSTDPNGHMEFVLANGDTCIHYDNNELFGLQLPDQHPAQGDASVTVEAPHIKSDYTFTGWNTKPDGSGRTYSVGDVINLRSLPDGVSLRNDTLYLYAQGTYKGTYNVVLSFIHPTDGKRYFLTHPGSKAPRYSRARHYDDWTNVWQGMANAYNVDPLYLNSFELRHPSNEVKAYQAGIPEEERHLEDNEFVLDPRHYTMKGSVDSLTFYEYFTPHKDEYLGLYYVPGLNTILANNTWAGLFRSTSDTTPTGWPNYKVPYIRNTKLYSTRYVIEEDSVNHPDSLTLMVRANNASGTYVKYIPSTDQFDGCVNPDTATLFDISAIVVADEHYVVIPDSSVEWRDEIVFDYHQNEQIREAVWSSLIGKQLMACMIVGGDTVYFHPNRDKIINDPNNLYLSRDFRVSEAFEFIRDSRVSGSISTGDSATMEATDYYWHNDIISGNSSPMNVLDGKGNPIDIVDTFRITLSHDALSKIKEYRGYWKRGAAGLHINKDGSRYRDVIVRTKTYHYGEVETKLVLTPEFDSYTFNPLADNSRTINFTLKKIRTHKIKDADNNDVGEEGIDTTDVTSSLMLGPSACSFFTNGSSSTYFTIPTGGVVSQHVILKTKENNSTDDNIDTLKISTNVTIDDVIYSVKANVPLIQTSLQGDELIWSVYYNNQRYYIVAGTGGLIFRKYKQDGSTLYQNGSKNTRLVKGSADAANSDTKYITPWHFRYNPSDVNQLSLKTRDGVNRYLKMSGDEVGSAAGIHATDSSLFTFKYVNVYTNENANEEEQVKLKYLDNKWLKFTGTALVLTNNENEASVFSWSYLKREYNLLNNGTYPSRESVTFGYNTNMNVTIQTRYKAYKEYSMLVGNKVLYLCREDENNIDNLKNDGLEWKTNYSITRIPDARTFDAGSTPSPAVSGLSDILNTSTLTTTVSTSGATTSPTNVKIGGKYVNIVDTLHVRITLDGDAPTYKFKDKWSSFTSIKDAELKIPLIRKTYHVDRYDSIVCIVNNDEYNYTFPNSIEGSVSHTFTLGTERHIGNHVLDVENTAVAVLDADAEDLSSTMHLNKPDSADVQLMDEYGKSPDWCRISGKGPNTITVECTKSGIRSPRTASIFLAYTVMAGDKMRFVNIVLTVSQPSLQQYANNQYLVHNKGASGDALDANGMQQVHKNKRILYYYPDQNVELPIRESHFFGWWRWFREGGAGIGDTDIEDWRQVPLNTGVSNNGQNKYDYPFRIIGDLVDDGKGGTKLVTNGRYTVFHYKSSDYKDVRNNPPCKTALVAPPTEKAGISAKPTVTYAVDISNYYDHLPMSVAQKNQIDTARLDTMRAIQEPTLSLREVFELRPWTEMANTMDHYKSKIQDEDAGEYPLANEKYMEDHVVMAPLGNQLLLPTEQRYNHANLLKGNHSESLLCYYMHDDNWWSMDSTPDEDGWSRKDSMIWCGGWDADCQWYTYDTTTHKYTICTHKITEENDFLIVPAKENIPAGKEFDTVYYCLRARSVKTITAGTPEDPDPDPDKGEEPLKGDSMFNICRYKVIYHNPNTYGPKLEVKINDSVAKALITNKEIAENYVELERLNFDYNQPGSEYTIYPHPLPWADASYGYTYPETSDLPHNRLHSQSDFPNMGEYGLINYIKYTDYWSKMEQHGGKENGYMIYCDGMSSAGQVAALTLHTKLCEGQKMYFSGYVGNCSNAKQKDKSKPNFTFSVQGSVDGSTWDDITSYMTGDLPISERWYQIFFPINFDKKANYEYFRVRIYNMSSSWDGNDFVLDDMCLFASRPPLIAHRANTQCVDNSTNDSIMQVVLRVDYQGFSNEDYNGVDIVYTVEMEKDGKHSYITMEDGYVNGATIKGKTTPVVTPDTIFGTIHMPLHDYEPTHDDSIFISVQDLINKFDATNSVFKQGYVYEENEAGENHPVMYIVHIAKLVPGNTYNVRMSTTHRELLNSMCAMTSNLPVTSHIVLELNGEEKPGREVVGMCANTTYDISMGVRDVQYPDNSAPMYVNGSCQSDWLLFGDTAKLTSKARYGYYYSDIVKVVKNILRAESTSGMPNANQFAANFSSVSRSEMVRIQKYQKTQGIELSDPELDAYTILSQLVTNGFLTLYQQKLTASLMTGDSLKYVVFPILGTGTDDLNNASMDVCPNPVLINIKPEAGGVIPLKLGGIYRDATQSTQILSILANAKKANEKVSVVIKSMASGDVNAVAIHSIELRETDDPEFREGIDVLQLLPDKEWIVGKTEDYYVNGDTMYMRPAESNTYKMRAGYNYTFNINMMKRSDGSVTVNPADENSCRIGIIPFTISVVPDYIRWDPKSNESNAWNNPDNWIGVNEQNEKIHDEAHFAPLATSNVIIPTLEAGLPYPVLPDPASLSVKDSIKKIGYQYNTCDVIRFMPGAAMANQQRMSYNKAVVDMSTPQEKWSLRSAPVTGMLSGDIFMANADLNDVTSPWEVGSFDDSGRNKKTGNASFWLSVFNTATVDKGNGHNVQDSARTAAAEWSKVTNGMTLSLPPASGWAIFTRTASGKDATIRLPKDDDIYYYFNQSGDIQYNIYEHNLQTKRDDYAGGTGKAGKLAFHPDGTSQNYTLYNGVADTMFVFGNPTMGYIDIWGFIADNGLIERFDYINGVGDESYVTVTKATAEAVGSRDTITNVKRYLPPMHAIVLKSTTPATEKEVTLNTSRVVTSARDIVRPSSAPSRMSASGRRMGIMKVIAVNPLSPTCRSTLLIGQGYHNAIREGEDAMLTTININEYDSYAPSTLFNIYASEGAYGLCIDLLDEVVNVPISFYNMSGVPFEPVTELWFTGVNNIDGELVFYDALTGSEQTIVDGICIKIPTPEQSHEVRYYIRRRGFDTNDPGTAIATDIDEASHFEMDGATAVKIIQDGHVLILRDGHIYTMFGQKLR